MQAEDRRATSIADVFDFSMKPRPFKPIASQESVAHFEHEPPSNYPPDGP